MINKFHSVIVNKSAGAFTAEKVARGGGGKSDWMV